MYIKIKKLIFVLVITSIIIGGFLALVSAVPVNAYNLIEHDGTVREGMLVLSNVEAKWVFFIRQFGTFLVFALILLLVFCVIGLVQSLRFINKNKKLRRKLNLLTKLLFQEPAHVFAVNAQRDENGTYNMPYSKHKKYQGFGKKNFFRAIGVILVLIIIITVITIKINHSTKANNTSLSTSIVDKS